MQPLILEHLGTSWNDRAVFHVVFLGGLRWKGSHGYTGPFRTRKLLVPETRGAGFKHHLYLEVHLKLVASFIFVGALELGYLDLLDLHGFTHVAKHLFRALSLRIMTVDLVDIVFKCSVAKGVCKTQVSDAQIGRSERRQNDEGCQPLKCSTNYIRCWIFVRAFDF